MVMRNITAAATLLALGILVGAVQACNKSGSDGGGEGGSGGSGGGSGGSGGSSGGSLLQEPCEKGCDKALMCNPNAAPFLTDCKPNCARMAGNAMDMRCKNEVEIIAKTNECVENDCPAFNDCFPTIPSCDTGDSSGTGGATGGGGEGGSGGGGPSVSCDPCTKADACCAAVLGGDDGGATTTCQYVSTCNATMGQDRDQFVMGCQNFIMQIAKQPTAPAACK